MIVCNRPLVWRRGNKQFSPSNSQMRRLRDADGEGGENEKGRRTRKRFVNIPLVL